MSRLCLVPAKPLARAKARLSPMFSAEQRRALALAMLQDVIAATRACGEVWVVCSDTEVAALARDLGVTPVPDATPDAGLNPSIRAATAAAEEAGYEGMLIVSSDLPCVTPEDVAALLSAGGVAIAPSVDGGTNGLWRSPPSVIATAFGPDSRSAHQRLALAAGIEPVIVDRPGLALDIDEPGDVAAALAAGVGPATSAAISLIWPASTSHDGAEERYRSPRR